MEGIMVRLGEEEQRQARRQLLNDVVWVICHDTLREIKKEGYTTKAPVELFLSARRLISVLDALPDMEEGLGDEVDALQEEVEENDAIIVMLLAATQMQALCKTSGGDRFKRIIRRIINRWCTHKLFNTLIEGFTDKEESRWLAGKHTNLLNYELQDIELKGGAEKDVRELMNFAMTLDKSSISMSLNVFNAFNNNHGHVYDSEIKALQEKAATPDVINNNFESGSNNQVFNGKVNGIFPKTNIV